MDQRAGATTRNSVFPIHAPTRPTHADRSQRRKPRQEPSRTLRGLGSSDGRDPRQGCRHLGRNGCAREHDRAVLVGQRFASPQRNRLVRRYRNRHRTLLPRAQRTMARTQGGRVGSGSSRSAGDSMGRRNRTWSGSGRNRVLDRRFRYVKRDRWVRDGKGFGRGQLQPRSAALRSRSVRSRPDCPSQPARAVRDAQGSMETDLGRRKRRLLGSPGKRPRAGGGRRDAALPA